MRQKMLEVTIIDNIHISAAWENEKQILILFNRGAEMEPIEILHMKPGDSESKSWKELTLRPGQKEKVELTKDFLECVKFGIKVEAKRHLAPISELTKLLNKSKPQSELQEAVTSPEPVINVSKSTELSSNSIGQNQQLEYLQEQIRQLEQTIVERENEIDCINEENNELSKENSELKRQLDTQVEVMSSDPELVFREAAHIVLQTLFIQDENTVKGAPTDPKLICERIEAEIKRFEEQYDGQMSYTLSIVKEYLTKVTESIHFELSELSPLENQPEQLAKLALSDKPTDDVQFPCLGELGKAYWKDLKNYTTKLPQVIEETHAIMHRIVFQLLDGFSPYLAKDAKEVQMARSFYEDILPNILQMMDLELVPIEIGQTEADSRIHNIQGSLRGEFKRGVVADIVQHGIYRISDQQIIRKPVVMRGEPD